MNKKLMIPVLMAVLAGGSLMTTESFAGPHHGGPRHGDGFGNGPGYDGRGPGKGPCYGGPGYDGPDFRGGCPGMGWGHRGHHGHGFGYRAMSPEQRAAFDKIVNAARPAQRQQSRREAGAPDRRGTGQAAQSDGRPA